MDEKKLETLYRHDDWQDLISQTESGEYLTIRDWEVPQVEFENEDDVTTGGGEALGTRLESALSRLWEIKSHGEKSEG